MDKDFTYLIFADLLITSSQATGNHNRLPIGRFLLPLNSVKGSFIPQLRIIF